MSDGSEEELNEVIFQSIKYFKSVISEGKWRGISRERKIKFFNEDKTGLFILHFLYLIFEHLFLNSFYIFPSVIIEEIFCE